jgi:alpha-L-rhamnosidase
LTDGAIQLHVTIPVNTTATVWVPTSDAASVTEGGRPAKEAEGVKFLRSADGCAIFAVGAGEYRFRATVRGG